MIDIHSHVLWGLDDGAATREESIAMLEAAAAAGTTDIVATPHANFEYAFDEARIAERVADLTGAVAGKLRIHRGCDFHLNIENVEEALRTPAKFVINRGPYLLVEFPDSPVNPMGQVLAALLEKGMIPVMTHPERHPQLRAIPDPFLEWIRMGCFVQITADSLLGRFGKRSEQSAWQMVRGGIAHFVASDAHGTHDRTTKLDTAFQAVRETAGEECAQKLFVENPGAVISGLRLQVAAPKPKAKWAWASFWK